MEASIDALDRKLISELSFDSSQSAKKLSQKLGVTRQTVASRIQRLEKMKLIRGFRAKIDYTALGYTTFFLLFLKIGSFEESLLQKALEDFRSSPHVLLDASVTGEWDVVQLLGFRNTSEYDQFVAGLRVKYGNVFRDSKSHAVLRIFKSPDDFVPMA